MNAYANTLACAPRPSRSCTLTLELTGTHTPSYPQAHDLTLNLTTYEEVPFHSHFTDDETEAREVKCLSKVTQL